MGVYIIRQCLQPQDSQVSLRTHPDHTHVVVSETRGFAPFIQPTRLSLTAQTKGCTAMLLGQDSKYSLTEYQAVSLLTKNKGDTSCRIYLEHRTSHTHTHTQLH